MEALAQTKSNYVFGVQIIVIVDTSSKSFGWMTNQECQDGVDMLTGLDKVLRER